MVLNPRESNKNNFTLLTWNFNSKLSWRKKEEKGIMAKWQQGEEYLFLEQVEELVSSLGCSLRLQSDVNYYDWYRWSYINTSSQALNYWKQLWFVAVPISSQAKMYCITSVSENSVGVNSNKGTSCRFRLTTWCLIWTPPHEFLASLEISIL